MQPRIATEESKAHVRIQEITNDQGLRPMGKQDGGKGNRPSPTPQGPRALLWLNDAPHLCLNITHRVIPRTFTDKSIQLLIFLPCSLDSGDQQ